MVVFTLISTALAAQAGPARADATTATVIPYQSAGWKYQQVAQGGVPGFQDPAYDDSAWPSGQAGFGTTDGTCSWNNADSVHTKWDPLTDIAIRQHFAAPAGTTALHISGTIDNDAVIYVNGIQITSVSSGFCQGGAIDADIPVTDLGADNVLAIRGTDEGSATYLDVQLTATLSADYQYVAMGDSYSSGEGAKDSQFEAGTVFDDPNTGGTTGCHRSTTAWANTIATAKGLSADQWKFAACSGAYVADFYVRNGQYAPNETEDPQMDWLSSDTKLVTFTIGGNDVGFEQIFGDCIFDAYNQYGSPGCRKKGRLGHDTAEQGLAALKSGVPTGEGTATTTLSALYLLIASRIAPGATIVVAGYPRLFGERGVNYPVYEQGSKSCYMGTGAKKIHGVTVHDDLYISQDDAKYLNDVTDRGDQIISDQVDAANAILANQGSATRVVMAKSLDSRFHQHRLCDNDSSYFNALILHGTHTIPDERSFHPNAAGQRAYAAAVKAALGL